MNGIVACETLYPDLPRIDPDAVLGYVPQWFHEYPIHPPESERGHRLLQEQIDSLEGQGVDQVVVIYPDRDALEGLQTESVPLYVYQGRDCIELYLDRDPIGPDGERKQAGTYYLTRGWIDVAVDAYKVYRAYTGELESLVEAFERARRETPEMRVSWPTSEKIRQAADRGESIRTDPGSLLRTVLDTYRGVVLIDTGALTPFHHRYAEWVQAFFAEIIPEEGTREVTLEVVSGSLEELEAIIKTPDSVPETRRLDPGMPVPP